MGTERPQADSHNEMMQVADLSDIFMIGLGTMRMQTNRGITHYKFFSHEINS